MMLEPLRYSRHARNRLRLWRLDHDTIAEAIDRSDAVTPSVKGRQNAWKRLDGRWVRVTFIDEVAEFAVVTVTVRRGGAGGGIVVRISYDPHADALYIQLRTVPPADSIDLEEGVTADLDQDGHVVGLEVLDATERLGADALSRVALERLPLASTAPSA